MAANGLVVWGAILLIIGLIVGIVGIILYFNAKNKGKSKTPWMVMLILGFVAAFFGLLMIIIGALQKEKQKPHLVTTTVTTQPSVNYGGNAGVLVQPVARPGPPAVTSQVVTTQQPNPLIPTSYNFMS